MGQLAVRLDSMREELHQAGGHIKNAGLALTGKEPQESKELSADKGVLAKLRSFVLSCGKVFSEMERDMALTVERINGGRLSLIHICKGGVDPWKNRKKSSSPWTAMSMGS